MHLNNDSTKKKKSALNSNTLMDTEADGYVCVFSSRMTLRVARRWPRVQAALSSSKSSMTRSEFLSLTARLPSGLLTVCVLLLRRPLCVESLWKLQLLLLERNWSRSSPENVSCSLVFHPPDALQKSWGDKWTDEFVNVVNVSGDAVRFFSLLTTDIGLFFHYVFLGIINQFQSNQNQPRGGAIQPIFIRFDDASFFCIGPRDDSSSGFAGPDPQVLQAQRSWRTFHIRVFPYWIIKADVDRLG